MFGLTVSGPLQLVKSAWLQETDLSTAKQNVVEFILNTRERLRHALDLTSTHAAQQRSKAKAWYDRRARLRTFQPGDKVLVLLPMPGKPLHAKYRGPYSVEQQLGPVTMSWPLRTDVRPKGFATLTFSSPTMAGNLD